MVLLRKSIPQRTTYKPPLNSNVRQINTMPIDINEKKDRIIGYLGNLFSDREISYHSGSSSGMGEWFLSFESSEFKILVYHDRGGSEYIEIFSKIRTRPGAHLNSCSLSLVRAFIEGREKQATFKNLKEEAEWLFENQAKIFDHLLLNSEELKRWSAKLTKRCSK